MKTVAVAVAAMVVSMAAATMATADPRPAYPYAPEITPDQLQELIRDKPEIDFAPIMQIVLGGGGGSVAVDPLAVRESGAEGGVVAHLQRNWVRYVVGAAGSGVVLYANHRDWWQDGGSSAPVPNVTSNGHSVSVTTGDDSPVTININTPQEGAEE